MLAGLAALAASIHHHLELSDESTVAPSVIQSLAAGSQALWLQLAGFLACFVAFHYLVGWGIGRLGFALGHSLGWSGRARLWLSGALFLLATCWIWLQNAASFHHSLFASPVVAGSPAARAAIQTLGWLIAATIATVIAIELARQVSGWTRKIRWSATGVAALLVAGGSSLAWQDSASRPTQDPERPNIVIIGIDGWRLDTLSSHGGDPEIMPHIEALLEESAIFEEGLTSLARSYPSWWSVLSGQHPVNHGARFNLIGREAVTASPRLTAELGDLGYYRLFAMDERRFANINESHGFDQVVGPKTGAADFLLGKIADTPLSNLLVNTWAGKWLFPHLHGNRAAYVTYRPETFTQRLAEALRRIPDRPLFLAVHHELPHWPYHWADGPIGRYSERHADPDFAHYLETLHHADRQVDDLLEALNDIGVLDNTVLFVISDHGEAFETDLSSYHDPRMTFGWPDPGLPYRLPDNLSQAGSLESYSGHGTHILSLKQHRIPIIFRDYSQPVEPGLRSGRAILADIYPTVMERLNRQPGPGTDGISLLPALRQEKPLPERPIPLETGFASQLLLTGELDVAALMMENIAHYEVLPDGSLVLRSENLDRLTDCKQAGVLYEDRIHAVIGQSQRTSVEMHIPTGQVREIPARTLGQDVPETETFQPGVFLRNAYEAPPCRG